MFGSKYTALFAITATLAGAIALVGISPGRVCAQGDGDQRARLHFESGASYYEAGEYEDALREFQHAYELSQRPQLFYNISLCYQNLGDLENAAGFLERYLREVAEIENRANLEIRLRNLRERLEAQRASTGTGSGSAAGTESGTGAGTESGTGAGVESGTGTGTGMESGTGAGAGTESRTGAGTDPEETDSGSGTGSGTASASASETDAGTASVRGESLNAGAIASFSIAGAALIVGGILGGLTLAEDSRLAASACGMARTCSQSEIGSLQTYALVADIAFGLAAASGVLGVVLLVVGTGGSSGEANAALRVRPLAGPRGGGLWLEGSF